MASSAEPVLASALWQAKQARKTVVFARVRDRDPFAIGLRGVDDVLGLSIRPGHVTCMSANPGSGDRELCLAIVVTHLLSSAHAVATVVDTVSSFDLRKVHQMTLLRVQDYDDPPKVALGVLERLKIMKVFDFEGLTDALAELRQSQEHEKASPRERITPLPGPRGTIGDSEDEEEDDVLDVELSADRPVFSEEPHMAPAPVPPASLLLIDNMPQIISPLIKSNYAQGQALLMAFMRSLSHLTRAHNLCTLIMNSTSSFSKNKEESPSAFASCTARPLLGKAFTHLLDAHLLVHQTLKRRLEAKDNSEGEVSVIEMLQNTNGDDVGHWAPFLVDRAGGLRSLE